MSDLQKNNGEQKIVVVQLTDKTEEETEFDVLPIDVDDQQVAAALADAGKLAAAITASHSTDTSDMLHLDPLKSANLDDTSITLSPSPKKKRRNEPSTLLSVNLCPRISTGLKVTPEAARFIKKHQEHTQTEVAEQQTQPTQPVPPPLPAQTPIMGWQYPYVLMQQAMQPPGLALPPDVLPWHPQQWNPVLNASVLANTLLSAELNPPAPPPLRAFSVPPPRNPTAILPNPACVSSTVHEDSVFSVLPCHPTPLPSNSPHHPTPLPPNPLHNSTPLPPNPPLH